MGNVAKKAILRAYINSILTDLMVKTTGEQVYLDESTTVAAKLSEMVTAINLRAKSADVTTQINRAIDALRQEMLGDTPVEAYNTFTELATYITEHQNVADALTAAVGEKAAKADLEALQTVVNALGALARKNTVSESDLDAALKEKVNAASEGNHSHNNKAVLDGITADKVSAWDAKAKVYAAASQPSELTQNDLWIQIVE